ncbi:hypothetical protein [Acinetobacter sp. A47]|uniref:hypothetical protein n=1 Tax=Acinetobacter sp. A47 TaxID=1561217 RepID=UPI000B2BAEF4|nr:hypothetical protein [Acinetobacter sp. A47]
MRSSWVNEEILKAQDKLVQLNDLLTMLKEKDHSYLAGDIEKVNYDLEIILERMRP